MASSNKNAAAVKAVISALSYDFGDMFTYQLIELLAHSAVSGARVTIEDEQRVKDAEIAIGGSTADITDLGVTVIVGNWHASEYGHIIAHEIVKISPNYIEPIPETTYPDIEIAPVKVIRVHSRRVRTGKAPVFREGHLANVIDTVLYSDHELIRDMLEKEKEEGEGIINYPVEQHAVKTHYIPNPSPIAVPLPVEPESNLSQTAIDTPQLEAEPAVIDFSADYSLK